MVRVNPEILAWARETAGFSMGEAAAKLGLSSEAKLVALEAGEQEPTRKQLANMAAKYHRPLLYFYLPNRPPAGPRTEDFRSLRAEERTESEAVLSTLVRDVQARQQLVKAALEETEEAQQLDFVASRTTKDGTEVIIAEIKRVTRANLEEYRQQRNVTEAFSYIREKVERAGVFVLLLGNLGSHHTNIDASVFRGFALSDKVAPFIVINETDSRAAWSFTLIHEFAHILLGQTGISGYRSEQEIEKFCDQVAADFFLVPGETTQLAAASPRYADLRANIGEFSTARKVSRKMVAYNLAENGLISWAIYERLSVEFDEERKALNADRDRGEGGPNYYVVRRHRIGQGLIRVIARMLADGAISNPKAGKVLGVKPTAVGKLVEAANA